MPRRTVPDDPQAALAELNRRIARKSARQQRWRVGKRERVASTAPSVASTDVASTYKGEASTPPPPAPPVPAVPTGQQAAPLVARLSERLVAFGRGYKHDRGRLEKLVRDFPHLDVEEEVADALDWLDRPENRKRVNCLAYHRKWCRKSEAGRLADLAKAAQPPTNGYASNGVYHQPQSRQHNRQPDTPRFLEGPLVPINQDDFRQYQATRPRVPVAQRAQLRGAKR